MFKYFWITTAGIYDENGKLIEGWPEDFGPIYGHTIQFAKKLCDCTSDMQRGLKVVLPAPVDINRIEDGVLSGCLNVQEIYIPPTVDYISSKAFEDCNDLERIVIFRAKDADYLKIEKDAFCGCEKLQEIFVFDNAEGKWGVEYDRDIKYFCLDDLRNDGWELKQASDLHIFMYGEKLSLDTLLKSGFSIKQANDYFKEAEEER